MKIIPFNDTNLSVVAHAYWIHIPSNCMTKAAWGENVFIICMCLYTYKLFNEEKDKVCLERRNKKKITNFSNKNF